MSGYATADEAAIAVLNLINPVSIRENREYAGLIYRRPDGLYDYTRPRTQPGEWHRGNASLAGIEIPAGAVEVGCYHTHGDYTVMGAYDEDLQRHRDRRRRPGEQLYSRPTPFGVPMTQEEFFSAPDVATINARGRGNPDYRGYLGAPNGAIYMMEPGAKRQTELQKARLIKVPRR